MKQNIQLQQGIAEKQINELRCKLSFHEIEIAHLEEKVEKLNKTTNQLKGSQLTDDKKES